MSHFSIDDQELNCDCDCEVTELTKGDKGDKGDPGATGPSGITNLNKFYLNVDATYGNNTLAAANKYNQVNAFQTLLAAETAASTGDTIIVNPGSYTLTSRLTKLNINWYFMPGAIVTSTTSGITNYVGTVGNLGNVNIQGYGEFICSTAFATGFYMRYCNGTITGKSFTSLTGNFIGFALVELGRYVFNFLDKIDCRSNLGYIIQGGSGSETTLNCPVCYFGSFGYWASTYTNVIITANVNKTVSCDWTTDFTGFAGNYASIANTSVNVVISIFGDLDNIRTVNNSTSYPSCLTIASNAGAGNKIYLKGNSSKVRNGYIIYCDSSGTNGEIYCDTNILNTQGTIAAANGGNLYLSGRLTATTGGVISTSGTCKVYLRACTLIAGADPCIDGSAGGTLGYGVYSGGAKIAPTGATNLFSPSALLVVDSDVE